MADLKQLLDDPDFLDLPESEQDSIISKMQDSQKKPNTFVEGAKELASGAMEGGLGMLQTAENMGRDIRRFGMPKGQEAPPSKFQEIIDKARGGIKRSNIKGTVTGELAHAVGQTPGFATQVAGLGGGIPGMAAQGYYGQSPETTQPERVKGAAVNAAIGTIYKGIDKIQPKIEAGQGEILTKLLSRIGLGGLVGGGATLASGGTPEEATAQGVYGSYATSKTRKYTPQERAARSQQLGQEGRDITQQILGVKSTKGQSPGEAPESVEPTYQLMDKSKKVETYRDLLSQVKEKTNQIGKEASDIVKNNNFSIDPMKALEPLRKEIASAKSNGHQSKKVEAMQKVLEIEEAKIMNGEINQDRVSTHNRKQELQQLASEEKVYDKADSNADPNYTGRQAGLKALASGYRSITESGDTRLSQLNEQYGPLLEAQKQASNRSDQSILKGDSGRGWLSKFLHLPYRIGSLVHSPAAAATGIPIEAGRMAQESSQSLRSLTKKVAKLKGYEQMLNPSAKPQLSPNMTSNPSYVPPPTKGPGPYKPGVGKLSKSYNLQQQQNVPYGLESVPTIPGQPTKPPIQQQPIPYGLESAPTSQGKNVMEPDVMVNPQQAPFPNVPHNPGIGKLSQSYNLQQSQEVPYGLEPAPTKKGTFNAPSKPESEWIENYPVASLKKLAKSKRGK